MANEDIKSTTTNPFIYKAAPSDAVKGYAKTGNMWLRNLETKTREQQANRANTASKWLNQLLETVETAPETYA